MQGNARVAAGGASRGEPLTEVLRRDIEDQGVLGGGAQRGLSRQKRGPSPLGPTQETWLPHPV
ncbi:hypothetical protein [Streptomyces sp. NBC_00385]|uniref:hypothetical protein n=1 Tax=Streptomyces sp. NBC_00385 TaxID=2975733 RepID=UPI002DDB54EB|nr:hypothetical protein [Streptomyces sp. NBC_00385]WRZ02456.1 hypothetical protein OG959_03415 [Streptomyces sp. NBC_00385]